MVAKIGFFSRTLKESVEGEINDVSVEKDRMNECKEKVPLIGKELPYNIIIKKGKRGTTLSKKKKNKKNTFYARQTPDVYKISGKINNFSFFF